MRKVLFLLLMGLYACLPAFSQAKIRGSVRGSLVDTAGKQDMSGASISVTAATSDSSDTEFVMTDKKGAFLVKSLLPGTYHLLITFEGYHHIRKDFTISATNKDV